MINMLFITRHLPTFANERGILGESSLSILSSKSVEAAKRIHIFFKQYIPDIIVSSDLQRCVDTVDAIKGTLNIPVLLTSSVRELDFGQWAGMHKNEYQSLPEWKLRCQDRMKFRPPGGESYNDLINRVTPITKLLLAVLVQNLCVVFVGHKAVNRAILYKILHLKYNEMIRIDQPNSIIYRIDTKLLGVRQYDYVKDSINDGLMLSEIPIA